MVQAQLLVEDNSSLGEVSVWPGKWWLYVLTDSGTTYLKFSFDGKYSSDKDFPHVSLERTSSASSPFDTDELMVIFGHVEIPESFYKKVLKFNRGECSKKKLLKTWSKMGLVKAEIARILQSKSSLK